jgi:hypothetical protein
MKQYRVTAMVTLDVMGEDDAAAVGHAIGQLDEILDTVDNARVTGIVRDHTGEYMVFEQAAR